MSPVHTKPPVTALNNAERTSSYRDIATWATKPKLHSHIVDKSKHLNDKPTEERLLPAHRKEQSQLPDKSATHSGVPGRSKEPSHWADKPFPSYVTPIKTPRRNVIPYRALSFGAAKGDGCTLLFSVVLSFI